MNVNVIDSTCAVCGSVAALMCQRCGEPYCNDVCQRKDWQRHKHFCIIMPPLVSLRSVKPSSVKTSVSVGAQIVRPLSVETSAADSTTKSNVTVTAMEQQLAELTIAKPTVKTGKPTWSEHELPPLKEFFECRVTSMDPNGNIWVLAAANTERLERLSDKMARSMLQKQHCCLQQQNVGDLVCLSLDKKWYRAEILALNENSADLRLIDYGTVVRQALERDIYLPVPRVSEYQAFAFPVKLPTNTGVQPNKTLTLRLLGTKTSEGIQQAQQKPKMIIPLNLPIQMLSVHSEVSVVKVLPAVVALNEPQVLLLQTTVLPNLNVDLNRIMLEKPAEPITDPFPSQGENLKFFLAARTERGYRRAFLIDLLEDMSLFLVYEMDEGRITLTNEVRRIPRELLGHTLRVFAATIKEPQALSITNGDLSIKIQMEQLAGKDMGKVRSAQATLQADSGIKWAVSIQTFVGRVNELGHKYWREPIEQDSLVYITHVVSYAEVCISAIDTLQYADIFKHLKTKCAAFDQSSDVKIGTIVLVICPERGNYRGEASITAVKPDFCTVLNIDTGAEDRVPVQNLRKSCPFLENLPISLRRIKIKTICDIPSSAVPSNSSALHMLANLSAIKTPLRVDFSSHSSSIMDLIDTTVQPSSLMTRMLPMIFMPTAVELTPYKEPTSAVTDAVVPAPHSPPLPPLPPSPPDSPPKKNTAPPADGKIKRYYFDNLQKNLIPLGKNMLILILNASDLQKTGYISACFFENEKAAENFQNLLDMIAESGEQAPSEPNYMPDVGEMCLALFSEDDSWYRGVCLKVSSEKARICYCDYGNVEIVSLDKLKPITSDLAHTIYATKCFISGFDKSKKFKLLEEHLASSNKICCNVLKGPEPNSRLLDIPNIDQILAQETV
ncbi:CG9925 [Drosophila busckii]|uniref:CG9925 n=1 Tax=Drosophila busckii TaxID=30019 RepID=A0A0M5J1V7_DROBS|nr:CG9925 [Drosophila busckii]